MTVSSHIIANANEYHDIILLKNKKDFENISICQFNSFHDPHTTVFSCLESALYFLVAGSREIQLPSQTRAPRVL